MSNQTIHDTMQIDKDFVFNRFPKTEHDVLLLENYKKRVGYGEKAPKPLVFLLEDTCRFPKLLWDAFPIDEKTKEANAPNPILSRFGFMALCIDNDFMNHFFAPNCRALMDCEWADAFLNKEEARFLRVSLIEFALLGSLEAQQLMLKLDKTYGTDDAFIIDIVEKRCPMLKRFVNAHEGNGRGVNADDRPSSYCQALEEVKAGQKMTGWIWYVFPQLKGIKGTHSAPALFYGIDGRREAFEYISHPILRNHLVEICEAVLNNAHTVYEIFGRDTMKVRACVRLFASVSDIPVFQQIINKYVWN